MGSACIDTSAQASTAAPSASAAAPSGLRREVRWGDRWEGDADGACGALGPVAIKVAGLPGAPAEAKRGGESTVAEVEAGESGNLRNRCARSKSAC